MCILSAFLVITVSTSFPIRAKNFTTAMATHFHWL